MFYKVEKEICGKGFKERYNVGQTIDDVEVEKLKLDFSNYIYTIYNDRKETNIKYYKLGIFNKQEFIYQIFLKKMIFR